MALHQAKIAINHNNQAGYTRFTQVGTGGYYLPAPIIVGSHSKGAEVMRGDYSLSFEGTRSATLTFHNLFPVLLTHLNTTYCAGVNYGNVTLYIQLDDIDDYDDYNAILHIPQTSELRGAWDPVAGWFNTVECRVVELGAI